MSSGLKFSPFLSLELLLLSSAPSASENISNRVKLGRETASFFPQQSPRFLSLSFLQYIDLTSKRFCFRFKKQGGKQQ